MDIQLDIDGQRLDQCRTVYFTRESWIQLVACDLHLQLAARVPDPVLGHRRRTDRWNTRV